MTKRIHISSPVLATMISILSAILGGTMGGLTGAYAVHPIASMIAGLCLGFAASIPFNIVLLVIVHALSVFLNSDFDGTPIGCNSNTILSAIMGGLGGMLSSPILILIVRHFERVDIYTLSGGCAISALVPIIIGLSLMRRANYFRAKQA